MGEQSVSRDDLPGSRSDLVGSLGQHTPENACREMKCERCACGTEARTETGELYIVVCRGFHLVLVRMLVRVGVPSCVEDEVRGRVGWFT